MPRLGQAVAGFCARGSSLRLALLLGLVFILRCWVLMPVLITGRSMLPALRDGQLGLVNKLAFRFRAPRRGEIVAVWTGTDLLLKRIVGLPGEEIAVRNGTVLVNGVPLPEPYVTMNDSRTIAPGKLAAGRFLVAGDNRSETVIAVVGRQRIVGRLVNWDSLYGERCWRYQAIARSKLSAIRLMGAYPSRRWALPMSARE